MKARARAFILVGFVSSHPQSINPPRYTPLFDFIGATGRRRRVFFFKRKKRKKKNRAARYCATPRRGDARLGWLDTPSRMRSRSSVRGTPREKFHGGEEAREEEEEEEEEETLSRRRIDPGKKSCLPLGRSNGSRYLIEISRSAPYARATFDFRRTEGQTRSEIRGA